jgi:putative membrane protein
MNRMSTTRLTLSAIAVAATLALGACNRGADTTAGTDNGTAGSTTASTSTGSTSTSGTSSTAPSTGAATTSGDNSSSTSASTSPNTSSDMNNAAATSGTGGTATGSSTNAATSTSGTGSTAPLAPADQQFVTKAAEGGMFEVEIGKLAAEKASDPSVKSFGQMLADDHGAANDKLRQIASGHNVALPASLPADKKKEIDQLSKLSGAQFDKQFVKMVGIKDHQHDISEFEKASKTAQAPDLKDFATNTLPTLKKHLETAQKLPSKG